MNKYKTILISMFIIVLGFAISGSADNKILLLNHDYFEEDLRFPASVLNIRGSSNTPSWSSYLGNTQALSFSSSTMEQVFASVQLPHNRVYYSDLEPHFHWSPSNNNNGSVVWCLEYTCANIGDLFPATQTQCIEDQADNQENYHLMTEMIHIENDLIYSAMCNLRMYRDTTNSSDTFNGDVYLLEFDIHYFIGDEGLKIN